MQLTVNAGRQSAKATAGLPLLRSSPEAENKLDFDFVLVALIASNRALLLK
jgi:hypothetical protein